MIGSVAYSSSTVLLLEYFQETSNLDIFSAHVQSAEISICLKVTLLSCTNHKYAEKSISFVAGHLSYHLQRSKTWVFLAGQLHSDGAVGGRRPLQFALGAVPALSRLSITSLEL